MAEKKTRRSAHVSTLGKRLEAAADEVMRAWRARARRHDRIGDVSYQGLELVHGGLAFAARSLSRLEEATQPPQRTARPEPNPPAHPAPDAPAQSAPRRRAPGAGAS
jgi:hypothetical protein